MEYSKARFFLLLNIVSLVPALADYELRGQIFSFDNPTGKCEECRIGAEDTPGCCDSFAEKDDCSGDLQCDIYFYLCLRPLETPSNASAGFCPYGAYFTSIVNFDVGNLTFTNGSAGFLGLPNPLDLWAQAGRWMGLQLLILVGDLDPPQGDNNLDELVDRYILDFDFSAGGSLMDQSTYQGEHGFVNITASFQVQCTNDSYGSDCGILCVERDDDQGHYTCDSEGNRVCRDGYQNPETNCTQCVPAEGCSSVNGYCTLPDTCICKEGYSGINCEIDLARSNVGAVAGGVVGAILAVLAVVAVMAAVVFGVVLWRRRTAKLEVAAVGSHPTAVPVDNPTYAMDSSPPPDSAIPVQGFLSHQRHANGTTSRAVDITLLSTDTEVDFSNPLYGEEEGRFEPSMDDSNTYSIPRPLNGFEQTSSTNTYSIPRPPNGFERTDSTNTYSMPRPVNPTGSTGSHTYASIGPRDAPNEYQSSLKSNQYASIKNLEGPPSGSHTPPQYSSIGPRNPPTDYLVPERITPSSGASGKVNTTNSGH